MAEEQFTSRRARREAERIAAEQAFEARETPEQPSEPSATDRAELLNPQPSSTQTPASSAKPTEAPARAPETLADAPEAPAQTSDSPTGVPVPRVNSDESEAADTSSRVDAEPTPRISHERGALATDHPQESRPPVNAEDRLDPQRAPLPHFDSRTARKNYLREHGLSLEGDVSTGAIPVIAGPEENSPEGSDEDNSGENESFDTAGFGGSADEVAARDFESPVTADSAPRPTALDDAPHDALSQPIEELDPKAAPAGPTPESAETPSDDDALAPAPEWPGAERYSSEPHAAESAASAPSGAAEDVPSDETLSNDATDEDDSLSRSRRMPIVQPPSTSGVRVVTAASAQIPEVDSPETSTDVRSNQHSADRNEPGVGTNAAAAPTPDPSAADLDPRQNPDSGYEAGTASDDAARALAANPETRPMETVPEAWALPNPDYEDEETENPPGTRIRASEVTGHDGRILVGEEPSKVPFVVLGVAALFAVALIVIALVMLL
ncbi:hypothetical protein [Brevibacterium sp. FME17]|uniref:hypothetical protein n=1 Tax=Brevibacterium sp. FME17 TaxID=2742606 RepID=UPI0018694242|nr:hypothetical protein [Brevibacterium sp. FME17]